MNEQIEEETLVETVFGTVTSKRVIYYRSRGWFSGGEREDIPLGHVTSVRSGVKRRIFWGIFLLYAGIMMMGNPNLALKVLGFSLFCLAVLFIWGSPYVVVNTAGQDLNPAKGFPWNRSAASGFVESLRKQLFQKN